VRRKRQLIDARSFLEAVDEFPFVYSALCARTLVGALDKRPGTGQPMRRLCWVYQIGLELGEDDVMCTLSQPSHETTKIRK